MISAPAVTPALPVKLELVIVTELLASRSAPCIPEKVESTIANCQ